MKVGWCSEFLPQSNISKQEFVSKVNSQDVACFAFHTDCFTNEGYDVLSLLLTSASAQNGSNIKHNLTVSSDNLPFFPHHCSCPLFVGILIVMHLQDPSNPAV